MIKNENIIGSGLIARCFMNYRPIDNSVIFASGVSNSKETLNSEFDRERKLLLDVLNTTENKATFVYFSTCSKYQGDKTKYINHKIEMEELIKNRRSKYIIARLPNVIGYNDNNTMIPFFIRKIKNRECITVYSEESRQFIITTDIVRIVSLLIKKNFTGEINLTNGINIKISNVINIISDLIGIESKVILMPEGRDYFIPCNKLKSLLPEDEIYSENYFSLSLRQLLVK